MTNIVKPPCDEGEIRSASATAPCTRRAGPWILAATIFGSSMVFIDGTVVNVALPALQREFHATVASAQFVIEAYALFLAALVLVGGSLGDHLGRRRIFTIGVALFTLASVGCGFSQNVTQLIILRAIQGIAGALLVPGSLAIISASFSSEERGRAIGTWSGFTAITSAGGPVLGGWLVEHASWRWAFFINVPLGLIVLGLTLLHVPESRDEEGAKRLDWWGALLATIGLGGVVYGLIEAGRVGLGDLVVLSSLAVGVLALVAFIFVEARSREPMLSLTLFRSRTFSGANLLTLLLYSALGGTLFWVPYNLIGVQGYSATAAGSALLPLILCLFLLSRWSGGLVSRYGAKLPLMVGPVIAAGGFILFSLPGIGGSYWTTFFPAALLLGVGMAVSVAPLTTTVMNAVDARHTGAASGINNAVARTAGLLAIAVLGIVVLTTFSSSLDRRLATLQLTPEVRHSLLTQSAKLTQIDIPTGVSDEARTAIKGAVAASFVTSFRAIMLIAAVLALASALSAALLIGGKTPVSVEALGKVAVQTKQRLSPEQP